MLRAGATWTDRARFAGYALTVALVLLTATSCGGSRRSGSAVLGSDFATKVTALCQQALAEKKAQPAFPFPTFNPTSPDVSKLPAIGRYETRGVQIFQSWLQQMRNLGEPPRGAAAWRALVQTLQSHTQIIIDQQAAAMHSDARTFTNDYHAGNRAQDQMVQAARAADVSICATAAAA